MTKEEAIKYLIKPVATSTEIGEEKQKEFEAYNMAIEALSAEPVQGVGRYENAMQKLREMPKYLNGVKIKQIKKISADRPSGEWQQVEIIDDDEPSGVNTDASQCSVCGAIQQSHYWATHYYNYCPSCGAFMKGGNDG